MHLLLQNTTVNNTILICMMRVNVTTAELIYKHFLQFAFHDDDCQSNKLLYKNMKIREDFAKWLKKDEKLHCLPQPYEKAISCEWQTFTAPNIFPTQSLVRNNNDILIAAEWMPMELFTNYYNKKDFFLFSFRFFCFNLSSSDFFLTMNFISGTVRLIA